MNKFWDKYPSLKADLEYVLEIMKSNVKNREKVIEEALLDLINSGGKLLRPGFLLISSGFGNYERDKICNLAAVIEMLHMATLVHDDIIDDARTRRGRETIQSKYGKDYAVFMGDILFAKCFMSLSVNASTDNMKLLSNVIFDICTGEIEQFSSRYSQNLSIKKYLKRISAKTAALFSLSFYIGSYESGCSGELVKILSKIGYDIGMAFQIIDDILDYNGDPKYVGKPLGNDLKEGVFTIPLIYAFKTDKHKLEPILSKDKYTDSDIQKIINITKELGGIDKARDLAKKYTLRAFNKINSLPNCESKNILYDVTNKLLWRNY
ncbi:heptaprenyl diphosphate synthase [Clostridium sp. USBA 49]|jgi:heptaprenyl diphosphate synthase|uniref:polyprenyl synthetase family protein n=1 Tax=Clostridium TaxID=1485 RepID=UPI000999A52D|nr:MULTISPECIES: polyprenyl synthetase family protein [Clostridium]SKA72816.1 heptaprenyl diphosphate synthase [Clostridium sp. USBA 49]